MAPFFTFHHRPSLSLSLVSSIDRETATLTLHLTCVPYADKFRSIVSSSSTTANIPTYQPPTPFANVPI